MDKNYTYEMLEPIIREKIKMGAEVTIYPKGISMLPLIREGKDVVVLKALKNRAKKYDIVYYKRRNGKFVLHRIVKVKKNSYVLCGDNQVDYEYGVTDDMIIAVMSKIKRDGKTYCVDDKEYIDFTKRYMLKYHILRFYKRIKRLIIRAIKKLYK